MPASAASRLLDHYDKNARALPWRNPPGQPLPDAYTVWLSEVMLQQTTVATVQYRFRRFIERWPTIESLAAASDDDVLSEWAGLGYYARARNLIACARHVVRNGGFPRNEVELRKLPGLGDYTAAAVAAIAFGQPTVPVDTNVARVVARYYGVSAPLGKSRTKVRHLAQSILTGERPGDLAQAIMDLGATICRPRKPICSSCPLAEDCEAFQSGRPESFPTPKAKDARPKRFGLAWWIERDHSIWLVRRPSKGLLGAMPALPGPEWGEQHSRVASKACVTHCFTHFTLDLQIVARASPLGDGWWQSLDSVAEAGLPTLYRKAIDAVLSQRQDIAS